MTTTTGSRTTPAGARDTAPAVPAAPGLVRQRICAELDRLVEGRLGVVHGMAGTGKTTALAHWASDRDDVVWWRATAEDDPVGLAATVGTTTRGGPPTLVVDDFHLVMSPTVCGSLEELLLTTPLRLVVASRELPPFNLARSEIPSRMLTSATLRFRPEETARLFAAVHRTPLGDDDAIQLTRHTAGWPAALHLFLQDIAGVAHDERRRAFAGVGEAVSYVKEYVDSEVLAQLAPEDVRLLQRTSILDLLRGDRCDALLGTEDSERRLRALTGSGLLTEDGPGFRLHPVIRSCLHARLRAELGSAGMGVLARRCEQLSSD